MLSQAQAVAQHMDQGSGGRLPPVRAMASIQQAAITSGIGKFGGRSSAQQSSSAKSADITPGSRTMGSSTPSGRGAAVDAHCSSDAGSGGKGTRQHADRQTVASVTATTAGPTSSAKRKSLDAAAGENGSCIRGTSARPPALNVSSSSSLKTSTSAPRLFGPHGTELMELEAEGTMEEDEAIWQRPQQRQEQSSGPLPEAQRRQQEQQQQKQQRRQQEQQQQQQRQQQPVRQSKLPLQPEHGQRQALQQWQANQQRKQPTESYLCAVAAMQGKGAGCSI
jgi:hypothetical protein